MQLCPRLAWASRVSYSLALDVLVFCLAELRSEPVGATLLATASLTLTWAAASAAAFFVSGDSEKLKTCRQQESIHVLV